MDSQPTPAQPASRGTGILAIISLLSSYLLVPIVASFALLQSSLYLLPSGGMFAIGILFIVIGLAAISLGIAAGIAAALQASRQPAEPGRGLTRGILIAAGALGALVNILVVLTALIIAAGTVVGF